MCRGRMDNRNAGKGNEQGKRVTVRDVAKEVGLHFTTVAEALRGSGRVKEATVQRVRSVADRMGYQADPVLSALSAYRSRTTESKQSGTLLWVNAFTVKDPFPKGGGFYRDCFEGAMRRSEDLGYEFQSFWLKDPQHSATHPTKRILSQNVSGLVVGPMPHGVESVDIDFSKFPSVRIGYSLQNLSIPNIITDQFGNVRLVYEKLVSAGCRRIGFCCPRLLDLRSHNNWLGGYLSMQCRYHRDCRLPPFIDKSVKGSPKAFMNWFEEYKPDALISGGGELYEVILRRNGISVPTDVQLVSVHADSGNVGLAGASQNGQGVGIAAIDQLVGLVHRMEIGDQFPSKTVTIQGVWQEGYSFAEPFVSKNTSP